MTDKELREIREKIACPQFGDNHYGEWGILTLAQRKIIKRMLEHISGLKHETAVKFMWMLTDKAKKCGIDRDFLFSEIDGFETFFTVEEMVRKLCETVVEEMVGDTNAEATEI